MTHINVDLLNSYVTVVHLRFIKGTYFYGIKQKLEIAVFPLYLLFIYDSKMAMKRQYQQTVLLKVIMYIIITHESLGLKFPLWLNGKRFDVFKNVYKKTPFRYYGFSIVIETFL